MIIIQSYAFTLANKRKSIKTNKIVRTCEIRAFVLSKAYKHKVSISDVSLVKKRN